MSMKPNLGYILTKFQISTTVNNRDSRHIFVKNILRHIFISKNLMILKLHMDIKLNLGVNVTKLQFSTTFNNQEI